MLRHLFALLGALCVAPVHADERSPEQILPPTTQVYARWDGIAAHQSAYAKSARGQMFAGETSQVFDALLDRFNRQVKLALVGEPLLEGVAPSELQAAHAHAKALINLPKLLKATGVVAGFEIRPPSYDLRTLFNLAKGDPKARDRLSEPTFQLTLVVPGAAANSDLPSALRLLARNSQVSVKELNVLERKVIAFGDDGADSKILVAWPEDKHYVLVLSNLAVEQVVTKIKDSKEGVTGNPLYKKLADFKDFRVVTRGFLDVSNTVHSFEKLARSFVPEVWAVVEESGLAGIKSACFWDGFEGAESRGVIEIEFSKRQGLTKILHPTPLKMSDLPPLPADLSRFAAARLDLGAIYEMAAQLLPGGLDEEIDEEGRRLSAEERLRLRKNKILQSIDQELGVKMADFFGALDHKVVTYLAPSDGLFNIGQVVAVGVKDEKTLRRCLDLLTRKLEAAARNNIVMRKRDCMGVEVREFVVKGTSPVTISYAICDDWLVLGFQPQPVRGFIYRAKGKLPVWKPDARTAATLAKIPSDRCVIQVADPRPTLEWLLNGAPLIAGLTGGRNNSEPLVDPGLFPHSSEACRHLFPNVMWATDDGKTMRWESRDSLWLPLEFVGMELFAIYFGALGSIFL